MQKTSGQFLSLSLFIILLSFFVFLRSLSSFDDSRVGAVTRSIDRAFSLTPAGVDDGFSLPPYTSGDKGAGDAPLPLDCVKSLFRSNIAGVKAVSNHSGTQMRVTANAGDFEAALGDEAVGKESKFRSMLVSLLLAKDVTNISWQMEIVLGVGMSPSDLLKADAMAAVNRVSQMTERLEALGMPQEMLSAGLGNGKRGTIDIYIRPYERFDITANGGGDV